MVSRLRGVQVAPRRTAEDLSTLANVYNVNLIRCQLVTFDQPTLDDPVLYKAWVLYEVSLLLPLLSYLNDKVKVVLDIHSLPGGFINNENPMFTTKKYLQAVLIDVWKTLAAMLKDNKVIYIYGICNEPIGPNAQVINFMQNAVTEIRKIDKKKRISITCPYSTPDRFDHMPVFKNDDNIWYEVHMYYPGVLTHQGIGTHPYPVPYPTKTLKSSNLIDYLKKVRAFQLKYGVPIYVGEFSISTFGTVDTRKNYLSDCIKIFEQYGWRWTYHAFREAPVWNIEPYPSLVSLMMKYWSTNKPA